MENKEPSVCIILLNYNTYKDTIECIESLLDIKYENYKILIIDNNSIDASEKYISEYIENISNAYFIQSGKNLGFSGGNNIGIKWAMANCTDYICLLNNDTIVDPMFLNYLVDEMKNNKDIGISSGKIMYYDKPNVIWSAGGKIDELRCIGHNGYMNLDENQIINERKEVTFLTGCLQLIRREVFENIGLYEEKYFLYMEDTDFCLRAYREGYKLMYVPKSKIYHKVSASCGGKESPIVTYYMNRNRLLFNKKYQENIFKSLVFKSIYFGKIFIDPIRKRKTYRYLLEAIRDYIKGEYGEKTT